MIGYIYKTTNLINNKIYIGKHMSEKVSKTYKGSGKILKQAFKKYGKENFSCEVIATASTEDELNNLEAYWIEWYNSRDPEIGYNIVAGGLGTSGYKHTEEAKQKMSKAKTGRKLTEEWKKHVGEASRGRFVAEETREKLRRASLGRKMSEEARQKMRDAHKRNPRNFTDDYRRKLREARAAALESGRWSISERGMERLRESGSRPKSEEHRRHLSESKKKNGAAVGAKNPRAKKVYCIETDTVYIWAGEAAEVLNLSVHSIRQCCQGKIESVKGYHFIHYVEKSND